MPTKPELLKENEALKRQVKILESTAARKKADFKLVYDRLQEMSERRDDLDLKIEEVATLKAEIKKLQRCVATSDQDIKELKERLAQEKVASTAYKSGVADAIDLIFKAYNNKGLN